MTKVPSKTRPRKSSARKKTAPRSSTGKTKTPAVQVEARETAGANTVAPQFEEASAQARLKEKSPVPAALVATPTVVEDATPRISAPALRKKELLDQVTVNRPQFAGGSKVSMDGAYGKK